MKKPKKEKPYWPVPKPAVKILKPSSKHGESLPQNIDFEVFGYRVGVVFSTHIRQTIKSYFKNYDDESDTHACHCPFKNEGRALIFLPFDAKPGTIAHEAYHAIRRMFEYEDIGDRDSFDNETVAYHLDFLVRRILKCQREARKQRTLWRDKHERNTK